MTQEASVPQIDCPCPGVASDRREEWPCDSLPALAASSASSSSAVVAKVAS